ncbi:MAG: nuclear transport factor 2 family protein [Acidimicrobiales bacterium]
MTADAATIRSVVDAYTGAFTAGDKDAYVALFTPGAWVEDPVGTPRHEGHDAIGEFFTQMSTMADSIELRRTGPVRVAAGECAFPMQARPTMGGTTMCIDIIDVMTFDDAGKITSMRAFWDPAEMGPAED